MGPLEVVVLVAFFDPNDVLLIGSAGFDSLGVPCEVMIGSFGPEDEIDLENAVCLDSIEDAFELERIKRVDRRRMLLFDGSMRDCAIGMNSIYAFI